MCSKETKEVAGRMAMLIWLMWNNRNQYGIMKGEMPLN
jgi:hypothetical protein